MLLTTVSGDPSRPSERIRRAGPARCSTTSPSTAGSWAAAPSGSGDATCSSRASRCRATVEGAACASMFGAILDAFEYGAPPHGGIALGIDRWAALLAYQTNIREVMAFPKTQSGNDPMLEAPSDAGVRPSTRTSGCRFVGLRRQALVTAPTTLSGRAGSATRSRRARDSPRSSGRSASRSRGSSTGTPTSRRRPARSSDACIGLPILILVGMLGAAPLRADGGQDGRPRGDRRRLLRRRPADLAPRHRLRRGRASRRSSATCRSWSSGSWPGPSSGSGRPSRSIAATPIVLLGVRSSSPASSAGRLRCEPAARGRDRDVATALCYAGYLLIIRRGRMTSGVRQVPWRSRPRRRWSLP